MGAYVVKSHFRFAYSFLLRQRTAEPMKPLHPACSSPASRCAAGATPALHAPTRVRGGEHSQLLAQRPVDCQCSREFPTQ